MLALISHFIHLLNLYFLGVCNFWSPKYHLTSLKSSRDVKLDKFSFERTNITMFIEFVLGLLLKKLFVSASRNRKEKNFIFNKLILPHKKLFFSFSWNAQGISLSKPVLYLKPFECYYFCIYYKFNTLFIFNLVGDNTIAICLLCKCFRLLVLLSRNAFISYPLVLYLSTSSVCVHYPMYQFNILNFF